MSIKKLIEVALPLEAINAESAREKSIRHGHPSTLHLWWSRKPTAAARGVLWASLVDDPSSHPDLFPTEEAQTAERQRLHTLLAKLVKWENSHDEKLLNAARAEITKYMGAGPLVFLDPFAGGGAIPLEAQRLGLEAHAHDLNPVAVMINKAMIEIPPKFAGQAPVNPETRKQVASQRLWPGTKGLADDVRHYGEWMKAEAFRRIGHLYPQVEITDAMAAERPDLRGDEGRKRPVIAWKWARTVKCPNPACGCEIPLTSSFVLSKKKGKEAYIKAEYDKKTNEIHYKVTRRQDEMSESPKLTRGANFTCIVCGAPVSSDYIKAQGISSQLGNHLMAVVAEGIHERLYVSPGTTQLSAARVEKPEDFPTGELAGDKRAIWTPLYGLDTFDKLFTPRQLTAMTTFSDLVAEAQRKATKAALAAGLADDGIPLAEGGRGALAYGQAVGVYLAFVVSKLADRGSSLCSWDATRDGLRNTFARQAIPMMWDYAEGNPFCTSSGSYDNMLEWVLKCLQELPATTQGNALQHDAQTGCPLRNLVISSDPPYYDNIGYADLSDFFYVWLRRSLKHTYPNLFQTMLVPKAEELVATPYRFDGDKKKARNFFEDGMFHACCQIYASAREDVPVTIYYAYKQSESDAGDATAQASTGWETMLSAIIRAGFAITGTWPMRTEMNNRSVAMNTNALASSIVLVCRKRPKDAPSCPRRNFLSSLRRELHSALQKLQASNIAPVDMAQAAIGPGMAVFSRYASVLEADGSPMTVRSALHMINQELDTYLTEQDGDLDAVSRFCLDLYTQYAFNDIKFGEADVLARAKNTSVEKLADMGLVSAAKGLVHLKTREELPVPKKEGTASVHEGAREVPLWLLTQQLTQAMQEGGITACAHIVRTSSGAAPDRAKALAYRLYTLAEQKNWTQEAYAYNTLVAAWPEIQTKVMGLRQVQATLG